MSKTGEDFSLLFISTVCDWPKITFNFLSTNHKQIQSQLGIALVWKGEFPSLIRKSLLTSLFTFCFINIRNLEDDSHVLMKQIMSTTGTPILRVILRELCRRVRVKFPKSWIQDFGLPKSWIQDFGIQDFGLPKSWFRILEVVNSNSKS